MGSVQGLATSLNKAVKKLTAITVIICCICAIIILSTCGNRGELLATILIIDGADYTFEIYKNRYFVVTNTNPYNHDDMISGTKRITKSQMEEIGSLLDVVLENEKRGVAATGPNMIIITSEERRVAFLYGMPGISESDQLIIKLIAHSPIEITDEFGAEIVPVWVQRDAGVRSFQIFKAIWYEGDREYNRYEPYEAREAIKSLFSQRALTEADDIDGGIDYFLGFIQGDMIDFTQVTAIVEQETENGKMTQMIKFSCELNTTEDDYLIFAVDYNIDTINPENEGIYMLQIMRSEERKDIDILTSDNICNN